MAGIACCSLVPGKPIPIPTFPLKGKERTALRVAIQPIPIPTFPLKGEERTAHLYLPFMGRTEAGGGSVL